MQTVTAKIIPNPAWRGRTMDWAAALQNHIDSAHKGEFNSSCAGCNELKSKGERV